MRLYQGRRGGILEDDYQVLLDAAAGARSVIEFGPGGSTFAFIEAGVARIVTLEHTERWRAAAVERFALFPNVAVRAFDNVPDIVLPDLGDETFDLAVVDSPAGEGKALVELPGQAGMNRLNTVLAAMARAPVVLLHDARREREQRTLDYMRGLGHGVEMLDTVKGIARITA